MSRLTSNFAAAFAAIIITIVSMQAIAAVPASQPAVIDAPAIA